MIVKLLITMVLIFLKKGCLVVIIVQIPCMKNRLRGVTFYFAWVSVSEGYWSEALYNL